MLRTPYSVYSQPTLSLLGIFPFTRVTFDVSTVDLHARKGQMESDFISTRTALLLVCMMMYLDLWVSTKPDRNMNLKIVLLLIRDPSSVGVEPIPPKRFTSLTIRG